MNFMTAGKESSSSPPKTPAEVKVSASAYSDEEIEKEVYNGITDIEKLCCLVYGSDGSGKSGICLSYLTDKDIEDGKRLMIIDLDSGNVPLIQRNHRERCKKYGRSLGDVFLINNPEVITCTEDDVVIDYKKTFVKMRAFVNWVRNNHKEHKIKAIIFDGLSTALKHAENQMRLDRNLDADGGVQTRFWLKRNKDFLELLGMIKNLPISSFLVSHEDFILKIGQENSKVKEKTNALAWQKIKCERKTVGANVKFKATIDKSKYNIRKEGKQVVFAEVDVAAETYKWEAEKIFEGLL